MRSLVLTVCLVAVAMGGCVTIPYEQAYPEVGAAQPEQFAKERVYQAPLDATWGAIIAVLGEFQFPFALVEKESGLITTELLDMGPYSTRTGYGKSLQVKLNEYVSCNVKDAGDIPEATHCKLNFVVAESGGATTVRVNAHFEGYKWSYESTLRSGLTKRYYWESCNSTGALETALFDAIAAKLGGAN